jgi:hypothetical protein
MSIQFVLVYQTHASLRPRMRADQAVQTLANRLSKNSQSIWRASRTNVAEINDPLERRP